MCNVLSDVYAMGVTEISHFLAILGMSTELSESDRVFVASQIMLGMDDKAKEAGTRIVGGQTVKNPWMMTGGSVLGRIDGFLVPNNTASENCSIVLTKPLGTQLAINFKQYFRTNEEFKQRLLKENVLTEESLEKCFGQAVDSMRTLNLYASKVMRIFGSSIRCCTDVTGFGIKGHSDNLVEIQKEEVDFVLHTFPVFGNLHRLDRVVRDFQLERGLAAETSGGLLIVMEKSVVRDFQRTLAKEYSLPSWEVGYVRKGTRKTILDNVVFAEV